MNKKVTITLIVFLLIITSGLLIIYEMNKEDNPNLPPTPQPVVEGKYLILDNYSNWSYTNNRWSKVSTNTIEKNSYLVYDNNRYLGEYHLKYGTTWNIFDDYDNYVNYEGSLLAFSTDFNIKVKNVVERDIIAEEISEISSILGFDINYPDLSSSQVMTVDLNNDGNLDKIVCASSLDAENIQTTYFNLVYVVMNNKINILINNSITPQDILISPSYTVANVLTIENEDISSIIIQKGYFSEAGKTGNVLYTYQNNKYVKTFED